MRLDGLDGANPVAALHGGGPVLVGDPAEIPAASPAQPGEFVSLFGTGFGLTIPSVEAGKIPSNVPRLTDGQAVLASEVTITIGGIAVPPEDIFYAGVAPCCAGLDQLVVKVPSAAPAGNLPVEAAIGGVSTPSGPYIIVQGP